MNSNNDAVIEFLIDQLRQQVNSNQCEDLAHQVQSLKNQLRDASALVAELQETITLMSGKSGCRKDDTQECKHVWCAKTFYGTLVPPTYCRKCGATK